MQSVRIYLDFYSLGIPTRCRTLISPPENRVRLVHSLTQHPRDRQAQPAQKGPKGLRRTFEYSIGNNSDQNVAEHESQYHRASAFLTLLVDDATCQRLDPARQPFKIDPRNHRPGAKTYQRGPTVSPPHKRREHRPNREECANDPTYGSRVESLRLRTHLIDFSRIHFSSLNDAVAIRIISTNPTTAPK